MVHLWKDWFLTSIWLIYMNFTPLFGHMKFTMDHQLLLGLPPVSTQISVALMKSIAILMAFREWFIFELPIRT